MAASSRVFGLAGGRSQKSGSRGRLRELNSQWDPLNSVGSTAHWLPVDLSFPLCSQTPVAFWKGQCPDLQDWGSLALPSYGGHVLTSFSLSLEAKSGLWLCHVKLSGSEMSELHIMQTFVSYLLCNSNTPLYLGEPSYL